MTSAKKADANERATSGLLAACRHYDVPCMADDEKACGRDLVLLREKQGRKAVELQREHTADERLQVLDYCGRDVAATSRLLIAMLDDIAASPRGLKGALGRGAFVRALAQMEGCGIPIDTATLERIRKAKPQIHAAIIRDAGLEQFYLDTTFKADRFAAWLDANGIAWPRTKNGLYRTDEATFTRQRDAHPLVPKIGEVLGDLRRLSKEKVSVGQDGRNRCSLMPFGTKTGRCTPGAGFIFGRAAEYRHLIVAPPGRALLAFDYANQELKIAACLSDDDVLIESCRTADPYMDFAIAISMAPRGATKATHPAERSIAKQVVLATLYGQQAKSLADDIGKKPAEAQRYLDENERRHPKYWRWSREMRRGARRTGEIRTCLGWRMTVTAASSETTLQNWPMQAHAADCLRLAVCMAAERAGRGPGGLASRGLMLLAPVHDALLVEVAADEAEARVAEMEEIMAEASTKIIGDKLRLDGTVQIIRPGCRYQSEKGAARWQWLLDRVAEVRLPHEHRLALRARSSSAARPSPNHLRGHGGHRGRLNTAARGAGRHPRLCRGLRFVEPNKRYRRVEILADTDRIPKRASSPATTRPNTGSPRSWSRCRTHSAPGATSTTPLWTSGPARWWPRWRTPSGSSEWGHQAHGSPYQLERGSDVKIADATLRILEDLYGPVVVTDGTIWRYDRDHWQAIEHRQCARLIDKSDGCVVHSAEGTPKFVALSKSPHHLDRRRVDDEPGRGRELLPGRPRSESTAKAASSPSTSRASPHCCRRLADTVSVTSLRAAGLAPPPTRSGSVAYSPATCARRSPATRTRRPSAI